MTTTSPAPQVERVELDELVCWRVRTASAELLVAQQGAQVLSYQRDGEAPLIWLSEQAAFRKGQSVRGGVPVCWPWFGALERNPQAVQALYQGNDAPAHGLVRNLDWQLLEIDTREDAVNLQFALLQPENGLPGWPHHVDLRLHIHLDERLHLSLASHNHGDQPVTVGQALHTYLAVGDIRQARVEGLAGVHYIETLQDWQERTQHGDLHFEAETDRIYLDLPERLSVFDPAWQRRIHLHSSGSRSAVVWNPWIDKSQRLSQFASDAWQRMLCIETANVLGDTLHLAPGEQKSLAVSLWAEPL
ncbi:D-hexose-6-phosphate mutarotase [Zestomonas carbonaria]|uniref:Putative glucose-6-phosphate 1-epimerase n=1 Tax=Zestomonas carbonaria TaxID=2762745 RepID=A0A7U7I7Z9_9GAMM|nr:D-hexose-6-phosphate mutarotase [Pseudomonas carbonaria]CAD5106616.1 Putative glucose-6-phosphate 1-epimerase [Pseudomonas carbonaria]